MRVQNAHKAVKERLLSGRGISPNFALREYGTFRLAVIINRLRKNGLKINTKIVEHDGYTFGYYTLDDQPKEYLV